MTYRRAEQSDMDDILLIVRQARNYLRRHRVDQWQGDYPDAAAFTESIDAGECYAVMYGERLAGVFCVSDKPESDYDSLTDGKWHGEGRYMTLHRAAVAAQFRGTGLSAHLMGFVQELAQAAGIKSIRSDTHRKNKAMQKLLRSSGFTYRGNVSVSSEPGHDPARQAFEKIL